MDDAKLTAAVERFLKNTNYTARRELEKAVRRALAHGKLKRGEPVTAGVTLSSEKIDLNVTIFSKVEI